MPRIADVVLIGGMPVNGAVCSAYKASRFASIPALNAAPPSGGPDAGPVTSGQNFGGDGEFILPVPTQEDYYVGAVSGGTTAWKFYAADVDSGAGIAGQVLTSGGPGSALTWTTVGGTGTVTSVAAADATVVIGGTPTVAPTVRVGVISEAQVTNLTGDLAAKLSNPLTTAGDLIYSSAGTTPARLGIGAAGQVLTMSGGLPTWLNAAAGFTNPMTTLGDVITGAGGGAAQRLGVGTAGQVLTVSGGAPAWATPTVGTVTSVTGTAPVVITGTPTTVPNVTVTLATPSIALGSAAAAGSATSLIRSDATIAAFDATAPATQAFADAAAVGSIAFASRRDHKHGMPDLSAASGKIVVAGTTANRTIDVGTGIPESSITNLVSDLAGKVTGVTAANATISIAGTATAPTVAVGTGIPESAITNLTTDLAAKLGNVLTTTGDLIYSSSGTTAARLGVGATNQILTVVGGVPTWQNAAAGFTNPMTTLGDIITGASAGAAQRLAVGSNTQALLVTGGVPAWGDTVASLSAASGKILIGGTANAPTVDVGTGIPESSITNLTTDLAAKLANPLTTTGDLIYSSAGTTAARLGIGSTNQVLTVVGGVPVWAAPSGGGVATVTAGDSTITVGGSGTNPTVAVNAIAESQVTGLVGDLATKAGRISANSSNIVVSGGVQNPNYSIDLAASPTVTSLTASNGITITASGLTVSGGNITAANGSQIGPSGGSYTVKSGANTSNLNLANGANNTLVLTGVASQVNNLVVTGAVATARVILGTAGTDTNVGLNLSLKGTGDLAINGAPGTSGQVLTSNGSGASPTWTTLAAGFTNPMTTAGDIITGGSAGAAQRLAVGSAGQVLTVVSGAPAWAAAGAGTVTTVTGTSPIIITSTPTTTPNVTLSSVLGTTGTDQNIGTAVTGQLLSPAIGTAGTPDTSLNPALKVSRLINITGAVAGDGSTQLNAIMGITSGVATNTQQPVGLFGGALNAGTSDTVGVYGYGSHSGTGIGAGGFFNGLATVATAKANGLQVNANNGTGSDQAVNPTGQSNIVGIWLTTNGGKLGSAGIEFGGGNSGTFGWWDTGIHFCNQVNTLGGGPVKTTVFLDDSTAAAYGIRLNGAHSSAALALAAGSGPALFGGVTQAVAGTLLEVQGPNAATDPLVLFGSTANTRTYTTRLRNASGTFIAGIVGVAGQLLTDSAIGDSVLFANGSGKVLRFAAGTSAASDMVMSQTLLTSAVPANIPNVDPLVRSFYL